MEKAGGVLKATSRTTGISLLLVFWGVFFRRWFIGYGARAFLAWFFYRSSNMNYLVLRNAFYLAKKVSFSSFTHQTYLRCRLSTSILLIFANNSSVNRPLNIGGIYTVFITRKQECRIVLIYCVGMHAIIPKNVIYFRRLCVIESVILSISYIECSLYEHFHH